MSTAAAASTLRIDRDDLLDGFDDDWVDIYSRCRSQQLNSLKSENEDCFVDEMFVH